MCSSACSGAKCLALQVSSAKEGGGLEIEEQKEQDVITRRMQFRMKKDRKAQQQKKKANKEAQKIEKEKEKEEKKKSKEDAKKAKADQKAQKQKEKQDSTVKNRKKRSAEEIAQPDQVDQPEEVDQPEKIAQNDGLTKSQKQNTKAKKRTSRGAKRSKLQRLHRMSSAAAELNGSQDAGEATRAKPKRNKKSRKASVLEETSVSVEAKDSKNKTNKTKTNSQTEPKKLMAAKAKAKSGKKEKETIEPCPRIMKMIKDTLTACTSRECTHPTFEHMDMKGQFTLSIYWSRLAVGVKMLAPAAKATGKRSKTPTGVNRKSKWGQIAYFGCKSECIYTNMVLAHEFATWFSS